MSTSQLTAAIFWMRVKRVARLNIVRAVDMLLGIGASLAQAVRFVAFARAAVVA